ncbi:MAG TPA: ABC transporter ATP-binding protein [Candidatus Dormibacteraeota bacterium]|nr:ABC transporter ATP-binding protein [Candidatus Dormibacteraeota bacterium]
MTALSATETVLDISGLTVRLPAHADRAHAIEDVSLTVRRGEIVCIVGESGSGKSVTAFSIMGLLPKGELAPVAGEIRLDGEDVLKATPARLRRLRGARMAMIFQEPMTALNPVETIGEQIDEVLRIHTELSDRERKAKVIEILTAMRLPDPKRLYDAYPHQISGGQRQRIMIAAAMVLDPHLLIADEPTTALDVTTQAQILALIKDLQRRHDTGVLFITHDFGVVADIAHRVVVMQRGCVVEEGPAEEVLKHPRHDYTRMLIAAIPSLDPKPLDPKTGPITLETVKLCKSYGGGLWRNDRVVAAAQDVNLHVRRGETLGIVGESGSGKTTVARCVARLIAPSTGAIRVNDIDIAPLRERQLRPYRRRVQVVFQDPYRSLNPRRTVGATIVEGPMNFGLAGGEALRRARSLLALVGLSPDVLDRYPHQFSGGQRQRIAIARALAMEPEILIADEAVSALDVSVQAQVLELLDDVKRRFDLAVLFITHDLRVAAQICDRIMVMEKGIVVEEGATLRVYTAPQHPYTRALLDAAPGRNFAFRKAT